MEKFQSEFQHIKSIYFNSACMGAAPACAVKAIEEETKLYIDPGFYGYQHWARHADSCRESLANLLGLSAQGISLHTSVTEVISTIAWSFQFESQKKNCVVALEGEYPSDILPWMLAQKTRNFKFKLLNSNLIHDLDQFAEALPESTRIINLSHVSFNTGRKIDLKLLGEICSKRDIFLIVDVSQSFGGVEITSEDLKHIDVICGVTYKWLLGPYGNAFAYWSPEATKLIERIQASWIVSANSKSASDLVRYTTESVDDARKYDRGQVFNMIPMAALSASLGFIERIGIEKIASHNSNLRDYFCKNISKEKYQFVTPQENLASIVCLKYKAGDSESLAQRLVKNNIDTSVREGNFRFAFHLMNTLEQVDQLLEVLNA